MNTNTTQTTFASDTQRDIHALAREIDAIVAEHWQVVLRENREKLRDAYEKAGDMAYGTYATLLFQPVHAHLRHAGLRPAPPLPGEMAISREWGVEAQNDEQRWLWSTITTPGGEPLGTIVTVLFHDHTQFRVPRAPRIFALTEVGTDAVVAALSTRSPDFTHARAFKVEVAEYLRN